MAYEMGLCDSTIPIITEKWCDAMQRFVVEKMEKENIYLEKEKIREKLKISLK
jgi:hypothetical protein